jgi:hypothetical protein
MLPPALVIPLGVVLCMGYRSSFRGMGGHKVGFGSVLVVDANICFDGDLGRGTGSFFERGFFRVVSLGNSVVESPCAHGAGVIGRVSVADASLSLSLSLRLLASRR